MRRLPKDQTGYLYFISGSHIRSFIAALDTSSLPPWTGGHSASSTQAEQTAAPEEVALGDQETRRSRTRILEHLPATSEFAGSGCGAARHSSQVHLCPRRKNQAPNINWGFEDEIKDLF